MKNSFWVVENANSEYWDGRHSSDARVGNPVFTGKIGEALKFASYDDAERARCWLLLPIGHLLRSAEKAFVAQESVEAMHAARLPQSN